MATTYNLPDYSASTQASILQSLGGFDPFNTIAEGNDNSTGGFNELTSPGYGAYGNEWLDLLGALSSTPNVDPNTAINLGGLSPYKSDITEGWLQNVFDNGSSTTWFPGTTSWDAANQALTEAQNPLNGNPGDSNSLLGQINSGNTNNVLSTVAASLGLNPSSPQAQQLAQAYITYANQDMNRSNTQDAFTLKDRPLWNTVLTAVVRSAAYAAAGGAFSGLAAGEAAGAGIGAAEGGGEAGAAGAGSAAAATNDIGLTASQIYSGASSGINATQSITSGNTLQGILDLISSGSNLSGLTGYAKSNLPSLGDTFNMSDSTDDSGVSSSDYVNDPQQMLFADLAGGSGGGSNTGSGSVDSLVNSFNPSSGSSGAGGIGLSSLLGGASSFLSPALLGAGANALGSYFASANQASAANNSTAAQLAMFGQTQSNLLPFIQAGQGATGALAAGTGLNTSNPFASPLLAPPTANLNEAALSQTPGYQFNLRQGLESTQNSFASKGLGSSGAAMKGAADYAVGLADNTYQNQFNNAVTNQTNQFNRLMALSNQGQSSAANQGTIGTQVGANIGNNIVGAANAGSAAIMNAAGGASNALTLNSYLSLLAGQQNAPSGTA